MQELAANDPTILFHGVLNREENARLLRAGKIAVVPYEVSQTRGFSFKTVECLAAGMHVITTRLEALEALDAEMKRGITYIDDNTPQTIATALNRAITERCYERTAVQATLNRFGPAAAARDLQALLEQVKLSFRSNGR